MKRLAGQTKRRRRGRRRTAGFSMVEVLMAAMILSVGFIMLLPVFIVALSETRHAMESSIVVQLGQNAEAYCHSLLDTHHDGNFTNAHVNDKFIHVYRFRNAPGDGPAGALPGFTYWRDRHTGQNTTHRPASENQEWTLGGYTYPSRYERMSLRVYGDPKFSNYYWSLLYRFPTGERSRVDLWIMICRRREAGDDSSLPGGNMLRGVRDATLIGAGGTQGRTSLTAGTSSAAFLDPHSGVVTNRGEILQINERDGGSIGLGQAIRRTFEGAYVVKYTSSADADNACVSVVHTTKGF